MAASGEPPTPFAADDDGVRVTVRVTPRAARAGIDGIGVDAAGRPYLRVRVNAPAHGGKANAEAIKVLAAAWGVPRGRLDIVRGAHDRRKTIHVKGESATLLAHLRERSGEEK